MDWLVSLASGSGIASIVGLAGGMINKLFEARAKRAEFRYQIEMRKLDVEESKLEREHELAIADKQIERAQVEGEISINQAEMTAFDTSQRVNGHSNAWVRPVITLYLLAAVTVLTAAIWVRVGGLNAFTYDELTAILDEIVRASIYLMVTCVCWWFGSRPGGIVKR